jgi:hypothetical protein
MKTQMKTGLNTLRNLMAAGALLLGVTACGAESGDRSVSVGVAARPNTVQGLLSAIRMNPTAGGMQLSDGRHVMTVSQVDLQFGGLMLNAASAATAPVGLLEGAAAALPLDGRLVDLGRGTVPSGRYDEVLFDDAGEASVTLRGDYDGRPFTVTAFLPAGTTLDLLDDVDLSSARTSRVTLTLDLARLVSQDDLLLSPEALQALENDDHGGHAGEALEGFEDDDHDGEIEIENEAGDDHGGHGEGEVENEVENEHGVEVENETEHGVEVENETEHGVEVENATEHGVEVENEGADDGRHGGRDDAAESESQG